MNNFNDNGDGNNELFPSQNQIWHRYVNRLNKPYHQNVAGNDFIGAPSEDYYNKHVPQSHQSAGPSNANYFPFEAGTRNNEAPFHYPVPSLPILYEPTRNVNYFPFQAGRNNEAAPFNYPVPSFPILNEPSRNVNNFPAPVPVTSNENIRNPNEDFNNFFLNNQHERIVKSANGNDVRVLTYTRDEYDRLYLGKNLNCNFCKRLGKPRHLYSSHSTRENGIVCCPVLRQSICSVCHRRGHTSKYCQSANSGAVNN